jgi:hypothetical protein
MWLSRFRNLIRGHRCPRLPAHKPRCRRLLLEPLEDRSLPSTFTAGSVTDLIADINAANQAGGTNTILLAANTTFDLTTVDNYTNNGNMLPVIAANDNLSIVGQGGDIIQRNPSAYAARLLDVAGGAALTLSDLTLQNGWALPSPFSTTSPAQGGAIYNQGSLVLTAVTLQSNVVQADFASEVAAGGAIWSSGTLTLQNGTLVQGNSVEGGRGDGAGDKATGGNACGGGIWSSGTLTLQNGTLVQGNRVVGGVGMGKGQGGEGLGGGLYIAGGTALLTGTTVNNNSAVGGHGGTTNCGSFCSDTTGPGGDGIAGGLYAAGGATVTLCGDTVEFNAASGGPGTTSGQGDGGGLFIAKQGTTLYLDAVTLANILNNTADKDPNIDGSYVLQPC